MIKEHLTINEMAKILNISYKSVRLKLIENEIKPYKKEVVGRVLTFYYDINDVIKVFDARYFAEVIPFTLIEKYHIYESKMNYTNVLE
jgi:hypothetical protein